MDDLSRRLVYGEVLASTRDHRRRIVDQWVDFGEDPTKSEDYEIGKEVDRLRRHAAHSAALAQSAIESADKRTEFIEILNSAEDRGMTVQYPDDYEEG